MRKALYISLTSLVLLVAACGGGGSPTTPGVHDLAGLEGVWDYNILGTGTLTGPGGTVPYNTPLQGIFSIGRTSFVDNGVAETWAYDGTTLVVTEGNTFTDWSADCGNIICTGNVQLIIPIKPGDNVAQIGGSGQMTLTSQYCGTCSGPIQITGTMARR